MADGNVNETSGERQPTYVGIVYPWQCDHMGHMNVMWYVSKFDEATWIFFHALGLQPSVLRKQERGMAALEQQLTYTHELFGGDGIKIFSRMIKVGAKSLQFSHEMIRTEDGAVAATCTLLGVHTDLRERKAIALPDDVIARAKQLIDQSSGENNDV